jgi:ribosomal protein L40E
VEELQKIQDNFKICKNCGAELQKDAKFCNKCGKQVEEESLKKSSFCRKCGTSLEPGVKFCGVCGTPVEDSAQTGQELQQLADSAKAVAKVGIENARKNVAKGMVFAGEKMASAAEKIQNEARKEENPESPADFNHDEEAEHIPDSEPGVAMQSPLPTQKTKSKWKTIIKVAVIIIIVLGISKLFLGKNPVKDVKTVVFDQYGSQTLGAAMKSSMPQASWSSKKVANKHYEVSVDGFCPDLGSNIVIDFDVNYLDDTIYARVTSVTINGDYYDDILSIALVMNAIY